MHSGTELVINMLEDALKDFDGKTTSALAEIRAAFGGRPSFLSEIVRLAGHDDPSVSDGATWIIKDCLEDGAALSPSQTESLFGRLQAISSWQAQLHICQLVSHLDMSPEQATGSAEWLEPLLTSERPFLRAWSMDALQHLAKRNTVFKGRAIIALNAAEQDPAASVRARARAWQRNMKA